MQAGTRRTEPHPIIDVRDIAEKINLREYKMNKELGKETLTILEEIYIKSKILFNTDKLRLEKIDNSISVKINFINKLADILLDGRYPFHL